MRFPRVTKLAITIAALAGHLALRAQTLVTLSPTATPAAGQAGVTSITLTGTGFPAGTILPADTIVKLEPAAPGTPAPPTVTTRANSVATVVGTTRRMVFVIPASLAIAAPTPYLVTISGFVSGGATFTSSNKATLTVNPAPSISLLNPNSGQTSQSLTVLITSLFTDFVQDSTQANFGPGISVGNAAEGADGPVAVTSPTTATAQIRINASAATGPRDVVIKTGIQQATLARGFTVTTPGVTGTITSLSLNPPAIPSQTPASVTATAAVSGTPDSGSVLLQRLDASGIVTAVLGTMHDDGLNGDTRAGDGIFTLTTTFNEPSSGPVSLRASATFAGSVNHIFSPLATLTVNAGAPAPNVTITLPANLSYLGLSPTTVSGSVSDPAAAVVINGLPAVNANGNFSASIPLAEGPNILTATATSASGAKGTASITVNLDTTPPHVTITSPPDQFITSDSSISVAGNVNDVVVGTVNEQQVAVKVNGVAAQVGNRTFLLPSVPLSLGANTIKAVATDRAGYSADTQITVTRQPPAPGQIQLLSGNNQTGVIGAVAAAPLVVSLTDAAGQPAANKPVIFNVTQNNGAVSFNGGAPAASVVATTDAQGRASAQWTLGQRAGAGGNAVQAYAVGFSGTALFTATGNQGPPGIIVVDFGNNQTGAVNQPLPKPFIAVVVDAGSNRLPGVPVTFNIKSGGGNIAGQQSVTVNTDSDGRAAAILTLGLQEGTSNNLVTADYAGNTGFPATFTASGRGPGDPSQTIISGTVLDNSNVPIAGVTVRAALTNTVNSNSSSVQSAATVQTDAKGQFAINQAPVGFVKLLVDGSTVPVGGPFPTLDYDLVTVAGQNNTVGQPIYLLPIKTDNKLCVTESTGGGTLSIPEAPGFSLTFGPGQVTFPGGSKSGCVSVTPVHPDKIPMVPGFGQQPKFIVTIQPTGALFNPPAPITLPNVDGLAPRSVTEMYSYDHDISSFVAIGTGTVSDDGQVIRTNAGVGVLKAGWHCGGNPSQSGAAATCGPCASCDGQTCVPDPSRTSCVNPCILGNGIGTCSNGLCNGSFKPIGTACNTFGGTCDSRGQCTGGQCPSGCNSGNPCITDSCSSNQCVATPNQQCQSPTCNGALPGTSCSVQGVSGTCDNGYCDLCNSLGAGASCTAGGNTPGTCTSNGQGGLQCTGSGPQCPGSCSSCVNGSCCSPSALSGLRIDSTSITASKTILGYNISAVQASAVSLPGIYRWSSSNPNISIAGASSGRNLTGIRLSVSGTGKTTLTVEFDADCGISNQDSIDLVLTPDVTVIGYIDSSLVPIPSSASPELVATLNNTVTCSAAILNWARLAQGQPILPLTSAPPPLDTAADKSYANAFLINRSADPPFGGTIDPDGIESQPHSLQDFRAYNRFQAFYTVRNGLIEAPPQALESKTIAGITPEPCSGAELRLPPGTAELHPLDGTFGRGSNRQYVYQINEARVGSEGQAGNTYINHRGGVISASTPWIWSVIEFDLQGRIIAPIPTQIFPTYVVYDGGVQIRRIPQSALDTFISLDASSQFTRP